MLNELLSLKNAIAQMNVSLMGNPDIRDFPAENGLLVIVDPDNSLIIKPIGISQNRWRYAPHNHLSFPTAKVSGPLVDPDSLPDSFVAAYKAFLTARKKSDKSELWNTVCEKLNEIIKQTDFSFKIISDSKRLNDFRNIWTSTAQKLWKLFGSRLEQVEPVYNLVQILKDSPSEDVSSIQEKVHQFIAAIICATRAGLIDLSLVLKLLLGKYDSETETWISVPDLETVPLYFDIPGEKVTLCRNDFENMLKQSQSGQSDQNVQNLPVCALTGKHLQPVEDTFPQVILPVLQKSALFAMNRDIPCHDRYGKIASDICNVGQETANQLAQALKFITNEDQKGKTWESIISDKESNSDLLIVYYEPNPIKNNADLATLLNNYRQIGNSDNDDKKDASSDSFSDEDFTIKTKAVISLLDNNISEFDDTRIVCLILRKIDKARRQLLYSDSFTVAQLRKAALFWQKGSKNVPEIQYWIFKDNQSKKPVLQCVTPISFEDAQELFCNKWIRGGTDSCKVPGVSRGDIFALFLRRYHDAKREVYVLLSHLLENCEELLIYIGGKNGLKKGNDSSKKDKKKENDQRICTLQCIAMLGILLKNLNSEKEVYMNKTPFNLGRLLALADQLHIFYCQDIRGGDIPSSLIGNALIPLAKTNPAQALIRLGDRLPIYMAWAKKYLNSKKSEDNANKPTPGYVAWVMKEMDHVSKAIEESDEQLTEKFSDIEAAQFLLGYLALYKGTDSQNSDVNQDEKEESEKHLD